MEREGEREREGGGEREREACLWYGERQRQSLLVLTLGLHLPYQANLYLSTKIRSDATTREREMEREGEMEGEREGERDRQTDRQTDGEMERGDFALFISLSGKDSGYHPSRAGFFLFFYPLFFT